MATTTPVPSKPRLHATSPPIKGTLWASVGALSESTTTRLTQRLEASSSVRASGPTSRATRGTVLYWWSTRWLRPASRERTWRPTAPMSRRCTVWAAAVRSPSGTWDPAGSRNSAMTRTRPSRSTRSRSSGKTMLLAESAGGRMVQRRSPRRRERTVRNAPANGAGRQSATIVTSPHDPAS